jgi:hypothetical protein
VFPDEFGRNPEKAIEATLTAGGIAEVLEDEIEEGHGRGTVTRMTSWRQTDQLGDSSEPKVSKTS